MENWHKIANVFAICEHVWLFLFTRAVSMCYHRSPVDSIKMAHLLQTKAQILLKTFPFSRDGMWMRHQKEAIILLENIEWSRILRFVLSILNCTSQLEISFQIETDSFINASFYVAFFSFLHDNVLSFTFTLIFSQSIQNVHTPTRNTKSHYDSKFNYVRFCHV